LNLYIPDSIVGIGIEGCVEGSGAGDSRDTVTGSSSDSGEGSSEENSSITLESDTVDDIVGIGIESGIKGSIRIETSDIVPS
jgi:hypothetical protein